MKKLDGKVAVVTGAGSGIGQATALLFAHEGAQLIAADIDQSLAEATAQAIAREGAFAVAAQVDVSNRLSVQALAQRVITVMGRVDILCNNAGIGHTGSVVDCTEEDWDAVMAVNAKGVYLCCHFFLPHMLAQGKGNIINMASVLGLGGVPKRAVYSASKGAVIALTRQMAIEYAGDNIRVNSISPGTVATPWVERLLAEQADPEAARQRLHDRHPLGRLGTADEIAHAALYLASPESAFATGMNLVIDGGANAL
jgi:meso-butanediol dehydrogenase/(S,S)-butanediol dehydrogenase/diacetyl reductase